MGSRFRHFIIKLSLLLIASLVCLPALNAQDIDSARAWLLNKQYDKAFPVYDQLYLKDPNMVYAEYLNGLLEAKKLKDAEKLVRSKLEMSNPFTLTEIDLGRVYKAQGKPQRAREYFDTVLRRLNGDDMLTQRMAKYFEDAGEPDYAIHTFERASALLRNEYIYKPAMANVYHHMGQLDKAIDALITAIPTMMVTTEQVKSLFLEWVGNDPDKLQMVKKMLLARINEQPDNANYAELLTWIYIQKADWDGALLQIEAVDARNKEDGRRLMSFAATATAAHEYATAIKAYDDVLEKGDQLPLYREALHQKLAVRLERLKAAPITDTAEIRDLMATYAAFMAQFPDRYATPAAGEYATLAAQYADSIDRGIAILNRAITTDNIRRELMGEYKLQMGDYEVVKGKVWDASLLYSQVDKAFRQDYLGEAARYRNARLAYYRGDFKWAQSMLNVLKASTTELIANDALYLSVLITENLPDSNTYPLERFAHAELLVFCNKDQQAEQLLDSIANAFPKHSLNDDILMAHANIAVRRQQYDTAIAILLKIVDKFGQDVLGDDALYRIAEIYHFNLGKNDLAKKYYEQLIIDFPGSTYVQSARKRLREINNPVAP